MNYIINNKENQGKITRVLQMEPTAVKKKKTILTSNRETQQARKLLNISGAVGFQQSTSMSTQDNSIIHVSAVCPKNN